MSYQQYPAAPSYPPPPAQQPSPGYEPAPLAGYGTAPQGYPGAQPGYAPAQAGYQTPPAHQPQHQHIYPGQAYPAAQPGTWAPTAPTAGQLQCRFCGSVPAVKTTFGGHQGMLVFMRILSQHGPFCRDCGLATFREMTAKTLVQGWWGWISLVATPVTVLWNLLVSLKVRKLAPPVPTHPQARPMDPGAPLLARPMTIVGLAIPVVLLVLVVLANTTG